MTSFVIAQLSSSKIQTSYICSLHDFYHARRTVLFVDWRMKVACLFRLLIRVEQ